MEIYIIKLNSIIEEDTFGNMLELVPEEKRERILRFRQNKDAYRSLVGDILARYAICKKTGAESRNLAFSTNGYGKPILIKPSGVHFNISHSGNWVVCAIDNKMVGIDVEEIKAIDFKIAQRYFTASEYISLMNQPEKMRLHYFFKLWTLKESYIKAEGKGLSIPLDSFEINFNDSDIDMIGGCERRKYYFNQYLIEQNTVLSVCTKNVINSVIPNRIELTDLLYYINFA